MTLSSSSPSAAERATVASFPTMRAQTMRAASGITGFTLPGMIDEPGWSAGSWISPIPPFGPDARRRRSFAILAREPAAVRVAAESAASVSRKACCSKGTRAGRSSTLVLAAIAASARAGSSGWRFRPVPTAVPPSGTSRRSSLARSMRASPRRHAAAHPDNSWPRRTGTASTRCVRPSFTTWSSSFAFASRAPASAERPGAVSASTVRIAARWSAVGKTSFELWPLLTWSFGWTRVPPRSAFARFAMTSFAFMFDEVPLPVWKTSTGNWASCWPEATSRAACSMARASSAPRRPSAPLATAHAALISPSAAITAPGRGRPEIAKFSTARAVWGP